MAMKRLDVHSLLSEMLDYLTEFREVCADLGRIEWKFEESERIPVSFDFIIHHLSLIEIVRLLFNFMNFEDFDEG